MTQLVYKSLEQLQFIGPAGQILGTLHLSLPMRFEGHTEESAKLLEVGDTIAVLDSLPERSIGTFNFAKTIGQEKDPFVSFVLEYLGQFVCFASDCPCRSRPKETD